MKKSKNTRLLLRLVVIPLSLLLVTVLLVKWLSWVGQYSGKSNEVAPKVDSFGIVLPVGYSVHGIDVSKHQGAIDWKRVGQMRMNGIRISFAYMKATEGTDRQDSKFDYNWNQANANGLLRGAYHFYYPSRDANDQADNFIATVKLTKGDLPPVVDIEISNNRPSKKIYQGLKVFINRIESHYHIRPIIYTNISFYQTYLKGSFDAYPLWIAGYFDHDRFYNQFIVPWIMWQHSEKGHVDGINGYVDFDVFSGSFEKLKEMGL